MKSKHWRQYYGYRPPALSYTAGERELARKASDYIDWLAAARGITPGEASHYAKSQPRGELIASEHAIESTVRTTEWLAGDCAIRTVRPAGSREHYAPAVMHEDGTELPASWDRVPGGSIPTTYAVFVEGRCVNSFLYKQRAKQWAVDHLHLRQLAARADELRATFANS